jgi:hypothetical protein
MLKPFAARSIGPVVMGERISDIALDPQDPWTFYVATAHGGLMKTDILVHPRTRDLLIATHRAESLHRRRHRAGRAPHT